MRGSHSAEIDLHAGITRRDVIRLSGMAAASLLAPELDALADPPSSLAKVVVVTAREPMSRGNTPLGLIEKMVEKGVTTLAGKSDPIQAWSTFVRPTDRVCLPTAGGQLENVPEVNIAVYKALAALSVNEMTVGTHRMSHTWHETVTTALGEKMPKMITDKLFGIANLPMDSLVVTPTVKHHEIAGISGTLKLYAAFSKRGPWNYHGETPTQVAAWNGEAGGGMGACGWVAANDFKGVRKLHIVDLIRAGTSSRGWTAFPDGWSYTRSLVFSTDPVAADRVAFDIYLKVGSAAGAIDPLHHVERADTEYHAGVSDLRRIDVRRVLV